GNPLIVKASRKNWEPNEPQRQNGQYPLTLYQISLNLELTRNYDQATQKWSKWGDDYDAGILSLVIREPHDEVDRELAIGQYVVDASPLGLFAVDCNSAPLNHTFEEPEIPLAARIKNQEPEKQMEVLNKLAEKNNGQALAILAERYWRGITVQADTNKAVDFMERAANAGDVPSLYNYAVCLKQGILRPVNTAAALTNFFQAADKGYSPAQISLAYAYI